MNHQLLKGKTAIVTGAGSGIGKATAHLLAEDGATVLIMARTENALTKTRADILAQIPDARIEVFAGDACQDASVEAAVERAYALSGRLDILVPAVGGPDYKPVSALDRASVTHMLELNFVSAFLLIHYGLPKMTKGGAIVCVSTGAVGQANFGLSAYTAANAALERFVRAAAFELGSSGIRINIVRPGATLSAEAIKTQNLSQIAEQYAAATPLGRIGDPYDIARVLRFLAGPESGWVTGETISADGGMQQCKAPDLMGLA
jgi:NAD(P)-dependent dehydrogenase (short-subunit alcohol dehydrogenase family)